MHNWSPNDKSPKHMAQSLCVYSDGPQRPASHLYHLYLNICLYLCNHHTTCICPQKAKSPKYTAQSLYVCSDGSRRPLISSVSLYLEERVLSNDLKNNHYTHIHIPFNHTLNHIAFESIFLIFKILSYFIQCRYRKPLTKHFNIISMRE